MKAVYYPSMVPDNRYTITQLAILFDQILLPGTYLPLQELDADEVKEVIKNTERVDAERGEHSSELLLPLYFAREFKELGDIFVGTGGPGHMGQLEDEAHAATLELENLYYGPSPPGVIPMPNMGFNINIGSKSVTSQINGPATFSYPANAYVYANKHGLPLISDSTLMPFPRFVPHHANAEMLASQLAMASLGLVLPRLKPLTAPEILEVRSKMKDDIRALHATLLGFASKLRDKVGEEPSMEVLQREADFIAKTDIFPQLEHFRRTIETPGKIVRRNALDLAIESPALITSIMFRPHDLQKWVDMLKATGEQVKSTIKDIRENTLKQHESGLGLLLKLPQKYQR